MELLFKTDIETKQSNSLENESNIKAFLRANNLESNGFNIKKLHQKIIEFEVGDTIATPIDIFSDFGISAQDVTFIHLQIYNSNPERYNLNDVRFDMSIDTISLGSTSLFTLANMDGFTEVVTIDSITIPVDSLEENKTAILIILVGSK